MESESISTFPAPALTVTAPFTVKAEVVIESEDIAPEAVRVLVEMPEEAVMSPEAVSVVVEMPALAVMSPEAVSVVHVIGPATVRV